MPSIKQMWKWFGWYRKFKPAIDRFLKLHKEGKLKDSFGRKFWMVMGTQVLSTVVMVICVQVLGMTEEAAKGLIDNLILALGIGVSGNVYEHTMDAVKVAKTAAVEKLKITNGATA